jgi:hypothetical protein
MNDIMKKIIFTFLFVIILILAISMFVPSFNRFIIDRLATITYGKLSISDAGPTQLKIFMNSTEQSGLFECQDVGSPITNYCQNKPYDGGTQGINITVEVWDPNSDCDAANYEVNVSVCRNDTGPVCDYNYGDKGTNGIYTAQFVGENADGSRCNYSAIYSLDYFRRYGVWRVNATAKDKHIPCTNPILTQVKGWQDVIGQYWRYPYPTGNMIDLGGFQLDSWRYDAGSNATRNTGNTRFNLTWTSTNFTCDAGICNGNKIYIQSTGSYVNSSLGIDNDTDTTTVGWFNAVIPNTVAWFPRDGVRRCNIADCSQDEETSSGLSNKANFTIIYHVYVNASPPNPPVPSGTYNNTFTIMPTACQPDTGYNIPCSVGGSGYL